MYESKPNYNGLFTLLPLVTNPSLFSSLLFLQYFATHAHFIFIVFFFFWRNLKSWSFFSAEYILYIIYIYKLYIYIYIYIYMSGYLVLVYFFLWSPGILQERYFETKTFLCLDWKDAHWVCTSFLFWLLPQPSPQSLSRIHISALVIVLLVHWDLRAQPCS